MNEAQSNTIRIYNELIDELDFLYWNKFRILYFEINDSIDNYLTILINDGVITIEDYSNKTIILSQSMKIIEEAENNNILNDMCQTVFTQSRSLLNNFIDNISFDDIFPRYTPILNKFENKYQGIIEQLRFLIDTGLI